MGRKKDIQLAGVIPATLAAFNDDFSIDEKHSRAHLADVAATEGISAITVNGHASEIHACSFEEQQRMLAFSLEEVGDKVPLINGIYADGSFQAAEIARMAEGEGASALLVFPPNSMSMGGHLRPEMALTHFKTICDATDLPIILFQYPGASGLQYPMDTLVKILETFPQIGAIKDWCNDPALHERHTEVLQSMARPVNVLTTHSAWLMGSLAMGANGLLSGAGSVLADMQVRMFNAIKANDLATAREINERYRPVAQGFYSAPFLDMHNRMKECLVLLGKLPKAVVRPPLMKLSDAEIASLRQRLVIAGMLEDDTVVRRAA
ncbi:MAG: dihydrodipicolinate synthase family protein [Burkholderiaceae bacterium]